MKESTRLDGMQRMRCASDLIRARGTVGNVGNGLHSLKHIVTAIFGSAQPKTDTEQ